jgi:hypothetical protein
VSFIDIITVVYNNQDTYNMENIGINLLHFEIIKIKIDTKIYLNYYYHSQSKSKQVKASQSKSKQVKASQSKSKQVKASQSKSKQVKASQSKLPNSLSNFKSLSEFYPETLSEECPLPLLPLRLSEWPSRSI